MILYHFNKYIGRDYSYISLKPIDDAFCVIHHNVHINIQAEEMNYVFDFFHSMFRIVNGQNRWYINGLDPLDMMNFQAHAMIINVTVLFFAGNPLILRFSEILNVFSRSEINYQPRNVFNRFKCKNVFLFRLFTESLFYFCIENRDLLNEQNRVTLEQMHQDGVANTIWPAYMFKISDNVFRFQER